MFSILKKVIVLALITLPASAQTQKLRDFKGTNQRLALVELENEFVPISVEENIRQQIHKIFQKYTKIVAPNDASRFEMKDNPNRRFWKPARGTASESQLSFLKSIIESNPVDILVLGTIREAPEGLELELQLFDGRIETFSEPETASFAPARRREVLEKLVHRVMNYMDRDGFVHPAAQDFLEPFKETGAASQGIMLPEEDQDFSINPGTLGGGTLVGPVSIGGEQTPFWERWWFWSLIGGAIVTGGGLAYYFMVVDQPPSHVNVNFPLAP